MSRELVSYAIIIGLLCAGIAGVIASRKNRSVGEAMFMSLALGLIGLLIVALMRPGEPKAPLGCVQWSVPRCNAQQNVPEADSTFECWRCKLVTTQTPLAQLKPPPGAAKRGWYPDPAGTGIEILERQGME
jgi:hypothetical protein